LHPLTQIFVRPACPRENRISLTASASGLAQREYSVSRALRPPDHPTRGTREAVIKSEGI